MHIKVEDGSGDSGEEEDQEAHHPVGQAAAAALRHQLPAAGGHGPGDGPGAGPAGGAVPQLQPGPGAPGQEAGRVGRQVPAGELRGW